MGSCASRPPRKRALLIGINYTGLPMQLQGCANDARTMEAFLVYQGWPTGDDSMRVVVEGEAERQPTRQNILEQMDWLVEGCRSGDSLFFGFSGHGHQVPDLDGDEDDGYDEVLVPLDFREHGFITDDEIHARMVRRVKRGVFLMALVDACNSGTVLDLPYLYTAHKVDPETVRRSGNMLFKGFSPSELSASSEWAWSENNSAMAKQKMVRNGRKKCPGTAVSISSSADGQDSADVRNVSLAFEHRPAIGPEGAGGACLSAFMMQLAESGVHQSYCTLLKGMSSKLRSKGLRQVPVLCSSRPLNLLKRFRLTKQGEVLREMDISIKRPRNPVTDYLLLLNAILAVRAGDESDTEDDDEDVTTDARDEYTTES